MWLSMELCDEYTYTGYESVNSNSSIRSVDLVSFSFPWTKVFSLLKKVIVIDGVPFESAGKLIHSHKPKFIRVSCS